MDDPEQRYTNMVFREKSIKQIGQEEVENGHTKDQETRIPSSCIITPRENIKMSRRKDSISSFTPISILRSIFLKYDLDYNGYLDAEEMEMLFQEECELTQEQAEACAYLLDREGENAVSFEDFNDWIKSGDRVRNIRDPSKWSLLKAAMDMFKKYDIDHNRIIDRAEFEKLFTDRGGDVNNIETAYTKMDLDQNNKISFCEFLLWLNWVSYDDFLLPSQMTNCIEESEHIPTSVVSGKGCSTFNGTLQKYLQNTYSNNKPITTIK